MLDFLRQIKGLGKVRHQGLQGLPCSELRQVVILKKLLRKTAETRHLIQEESKNDMFWEINQQKQDTSSRSPVMGTSMKGNREMQLEVGREIFI